MDRHGAEALDTGDPLAGARSAFRLPEGLVYLNGNSLGPLQPAVEQRLRSLVTDEWGVGLKRSWNDAGWAHLPETVARRLAPLIGADPHEVAVADSTSVDLFKALVAARRLRPDRRVVLTDEANFPTDRYVAGGVADLLADTELVVVPTDELVARLDDDVAVLTTTHVDYRSGRRADAFAVTRAAHDAGALVVWDLSHSAGAVAVDLHAWGADLAVGCTYKYLNGGPGAPGYLYAAARHHAALDVAIRGWFGHARPFDFGDTYQPAADARRFLAGTPPIASMAAVEAALRIWEDVDLAAAHAKAAALTDLFIALVDDRLAGLDVAVASPRAAGERGAQVSLVHPEAYAVSSAITEAGVIGDVRPPELLRFGFSPLYVRYVDVWDAVETLRGVLVARAWDDPRHRRRETVS